MVFQAEAFRPVGGQCAAGRGSLQGADRLMSMPKDFTFTDYKPYDFANRRHIGPSPDEMAAMLQVIGYDSLDALIDDTVPPSIRQKSPLAWGAAMTEREALDKMRETANRNKKLVSLIGQGYYGTITPPVIQRNILENP